MFRKVFSLGGLLLLAGAAVLATPGSGQAQHRGGGGHGGGFHSGGFNHGGFNHGGFNHGGFNHGGFHHRGFDHRGFHGGRLWWYPGYYGAYGGWPYTYGYYPYYGYYPDSYDAYGYSSSSPAYDSGYYGAYGSVTSSYPESYAPAAAQPDTSAHVDVSVPPDAEIWFEGSKMTSTGSVREFRSPPLAPGSRYAYAVRARWNENGHEVTQTQQVRVTAGAHVSVRFPVQPTGARTAPSD
jgi:uncharacterized protein (TIGR03000 family)